MTWFGLTFLALVVGSATHAVQPRDSATTTRKTILPNLDFNEKLLVMGEGHEVKLFRLSDGKRLKRLKGHQEVVRAVALSPDGRYVLSGGGRTDDMASVSKDNSIRLWEVVTGKEVKRFEGHASYIHFIQFTPDGKRALTLDRTGSAVLWDLFSGKQLARFSKLGPYPHSATLSPDGNLVLGLVGVGRSITIWQSRSAKVVSQIPMIGENLWSKAIFGPRSKRVLACAENFVQIIDAKNGKQLATLKGHTKAVHYATMTPDGKWVVTGSSDKTVRLWDARTGKQLRQFPNKGKVYDLLLDQSGTKVIAYWENWPNRESRILGDAVWDLRSGKKLLDRNDVYGFNGDGTRFLTDNWKWRSCRTGKIVRQAE